MAILLDCVVCGHSFSGPDTTPEVCCPDCRSVSTEWCQQNKGLLSDEQLLVEVSKMRADRAQRLSADREFCERETIKPPSLLDGIKFR